jgi:hypothetical protein
MFDLFISHNRAEKEWARSLVIELRKLNLNCFFDEESIRLGDDIIQKIGDGLKTSRHVALLLSPDSVKSRWVELEWASSMYEDVDASARKLIPILRRTCEIPYVLKRLNYLDARDLDTETVARKLADAILPEGNFAGLSEATAIVEKVEKRGLFPTNAPVMPFSKFYIERDADARVRQVIIDGGSAIVYGPRMVGKTSLLKKAMAEATLLGKFCAFVDLNGTSKAEEIWTYIAYRLSDISGVVWERRTYLPFALQVDRFFRSICNQLSLVLLIDEADLIARSEDPATTGILRSLVNDPDLRGRLSILCAGWQPHRQMEIDLQVSPWWNVFELVRVRAFSIQELQGICDRLDLKIEDSDLKSAYRLTAGHPWLVAGLLKAVLRGEAVRHIYRNPAGSEFDFWSQPAMAYRTAKSLLGNDFSSALKALLAGGRVPSRKVREILWLTGVTKDIDDDPPVCSELFSQWAASEASDDPPQNE